LADEVYMKSYKNIFYRHLSGWTWEIKFLSGSTTQGQFSSEEAVQIKIEKLLREEGPACFPHLEEDS